MNTGRKFSMTEQQATPISWDARTRNVISMHLIVEQTAALIIR